MKPIFLIVIFALILSVIGGAFYYFTNKPQELVKPAVKEEKDVNPDVESPVEIEKTKSEVVKSSPKDSSKTSANNISSKPVELNVHLHDFDEDFICNQSMGELYSCENKDKEKKTHLEISLVKSIPNGKFSVSENNVISIEGNYIHGFINGEVTKYFSNGVINTLENYKSGVLDGARTAYSKDIAKESGSVLRQEQHWTEGLPDGVFIKNGFDGNLIRKVEFTKGEFKGEV